MNTLTDQIKLIESFQVKMKQQCHVAKEIECVSRYAQALEDAPGMTLIGRSGSGKSFVAKQVLSALGWSKAAHHGYRQIAQYGIYCTVKPPVSYDQITSSLLDAIGAPAPDQGSLLSKSARLKSLISSTKVQLIVLDHAHNLLTPRPGEQPEIRIQGLCDWLLGLVESIKPCVLLVGLESLSKLKFRDERLLQRFTMEFNLNHPPPPIQGQPDDFQQLLGGI